MKYEGKIVKYIFFIIIIGLLALSIYIISLDNKNFATEIGKYSKKEKYKNNILIGITNLDTLNPLLTKNRDVQHILNLIYEPILRISKDFKLNPCLAEEYSKLESKTYIIKLKDSKTFHDGGKFTAKDVEFTINAIKNCWKDSIYFDNVKGIESIDIIDDYTLKIHLAEEIPYFEYKLVLPIIAEHQYNEKFEFIGSIPVGTGNYSIKEILDEQIVLKSNNAKTKEIAVKLYNRNADIYSDFLKQKLDLITTSNIDYEKYLGTIGYKVVRIPDRYFTYLLINQNNAFLKDEALRKAINLTINRKEIIYNVYNNKYIEMNFPQDTEAKTECNPNEAKKVLEEAGYIFKSSILYKNGKKISLKLTLNEEDSYSSKVAEIIKENLKDLGINIDIKILNKSNYEYNLENKYYDLIFSESILCLEPNYKEYFRFNNTETNNLLHEIESIDNEKVREEKIEELKRITEEEKPFIGLYVDTNSLLLNKDLRGDFEANWYNIFYNIDTWYIVEK